MPQQSPPPVDDVVPLNLPIPRTQPEHLAAIGAMRGMRPCPVGESKVLEIGCGDGSNLIPLAERYPKSQFLGIDASEQHLAAAEASARAMGLDNIAFSRRSLAALDSAGGPYDYVIASGIYSWVGAEGRDRLLAACRENLAPDGIAYVNYNVRPGWQVHDLVRSMMRYQARWAQTVPQRLEAGRTLLSFLSSTLPAGDGGYGSLLRATVDPILEQPDSVLLHDYLNGVSHAVYFTQFVDHARRHELQVLGDAATGVRVSDFLTPSVELGLTEAFPDSDDREQFRDVLRGKAHRQSLLCRSEIELAPGLAPQGIRGTYLEAQLTPLDAGVPVNSPAPNTFTAADGTNVTASLPSIKAALAHLGSIWPNYVSFDELIKTVRAGLEASEDRSESPDDEAERIRNNLLQCCTSGIIHLHGAPQSFVAEVSEHPTAGPVARYQTAHDSIVTNRKHLRVRLNPFDRHVLTLLDGTRNFEGLFDFLAQMTETGQVQMVEQGQPVPEDRQAEFLRRELSASLERLAANALLIA